MTYKNTTLKVTSIGNEAFAFCDELSSVIIPNSVTTIGNYAFRNCTNLPPLEIPNSVTSIGNYAFWKCYNFTSITIPSSVTSIGYNAFGDCRYLTSIISLIGNPYVIEGKSSSYSVFDKNIFNNATLYVPAGTVDKYKETEGWRDFANIKEIDVPTGILTTREFDVRIMQ